MSEANGAASRDTAQRPSDYQHEIEARVHAERAEAEKWHREHEVRQRDADYRTLRAAALRLACDTHAGCGDPHRVTKTAEAFLTWVLEGDPA